MAWSDLQLVNYLLPLLYFCYCVLIRGRGTYTAGMVSSVPLLKVGRKSVHFPSHFWWPDISKMHQIAQISSYIFLKNFPGVTPSDP